METIKKFKSNLINPQDLSNLIGGGSYTDIVETPTGTISHIIYDDGREYWVLSQGNNEYIDQSGPSDWASDGDVG